ncbi:alpha/beta fold hydrolase [Colwellia sp. MEBiC06753]
MWKSYLIKLFGMALGKLLGKELGILLGLALLLITPAKAAEPYPLIFDDCHLDGIREQVKCGKLTVPENYQQPEATTIEINFAVLPAIDSAQNKSPLMFLAGGPGQAATELAPMIRRNFYEIRKTRDIILVDQRGTGQSSPLLCDNNALNIKDVYQMSSTEFDVDEIHQCLSEFKQELGQYNSENAIRDFDAVRAALGYEQINLYGGSYGTRAALVYLRLFPENLASVVLDSVGPIEVPIGPFGQSAARSFNLLVENCAAEPACHQAYPNLANEFQEVYSALAAKAKTITIAHPRLGTPTDFVVDVEKFVDTLRMQLYSMPMRTIVPLVIHQAYLGNYMPLAGLVAQNDSEHQAGGIYSGLTLNIVCNEDFPRISPSAWQQDGDNNFGRKISHRGWQLACPLWPKYQVADEFYQPVTAKVPTLILSGNLDPVTPPSNGEYANKTLVNSRHIIIKNAAHIAASSECAVGLVNQFIDTLDLAALDETCLTELPDESFMTSLNGNM